VIRGAALLALVLLAALMLVPAALGWQRYVITGGSMGGTIARGSIVYEEPVPVGRLRVGDVITFTPPTRSDRVTHRIAAIGRDGELRTKGDANAATDPWRIRPSGARQPVVRFHVPLAGYAFAALSIRWVRMLVIGVPALVVAAASLARVRGEQAMPA
jgi:signal peptidase